MANIDIYQQGLEGLCRKYHIRKLALFGSALRKDFGPEVDILPSGLLK